jgi:hypothetical protein
MAGIGFVVSDILKYQNAGKHLRAQILMSSDLKMAYMKVVELKILRLKSLLIFLHISHPFGVMASGASGSKLDLRNKHFQCKIFKIL